MKKKKFPFIVLLPVVLYNLNFRKVTISDSLVRCLKKGKGDEQALAAQCCSMLCIQLGSDADEVMTDMRPAFLTVLADNSSAVKARGEVGIHVLSASQKPTYFVIFISDLGKPSDLSLFKVLCLTYASKYELHQKKTWLGLSDQ